MNLQIRFGALTNNDGHREFIIGLCLGRCTYCTLSHLGADLSRQSSDKVMICDGVVRMFVNPSTPSNPSHAAGTKVITTSISGLWQWYFARVTTH